MVVVASKEYIPNGRDVEADTQNAGLVKQLRRKPKESWTSYKARRLGYIENFVSDDEKGNYLYKIIITQEWKWKVWNITTSCIIP